jgi:hypothetical protein
MYISFKNLELPKGYTPDPNNILRIFKDIAYVKQNLGGFEELSGVDYYNHQTHREFIFYDNILPVEVAIRRDGLTILTKVLGIENPNKYRVKSYKVITGASNSVVRVYLDSNTHPHVDSSKKYCMPPIVSEGPFSSFRFEKLRSSLFRWNLARCYPENVPPPEDLSLMPVFTEEE